MQDVYSWLVSGGLQRKAFNVSLATVHLSFKSNLYTNPSTIRTNQALLWTLFYNVYFCLWSSLQSLCEEVKKYCVVFIDCAVFISPCQTFHAAIVQNFFWDFSHTWCNSEYVYNSQVVVYISNHMFFLFHFLYYIGHFPTTTTHMF